MISEATCSTITMTSVGDFVATMTDACGAVHCTATPVGEYETGMKKVGEVHCRMFQVCESSVNMPYLEISPTIVWLLAGHTENDVYSNTDWNIN